MFNDLVITVPPSTQSDRKGVFLLATLFLGVTLAAALLISLFSIKVSLGNGDLSIVRLLAPVAMPEAEPEVPAPAAEPEQVVQAEAPAKMPTRRVNIARVDESPRTVPKSVSTARNTEKARPANRYFTIGKFDTDPVGAAPSGRSTVRGQAVEAGGLSTGKTAAATPEEKAAPPPPPVKKDPPAAKKPVVRSMGVINGKAASLPKPAYPAAARAVNAKGAVNVKVLIDENGRVTSATATSGHPLLREAAEAAARRARFTPTILSGEPVKISGTIVYNFMS